MINFKALAGITLSGVLLAGNFTVAAQNVQRRTSATWTGFQARVTQTQSATTKKATTKAVKVSNYHQKRKKSSVVSNTPEPTATQVSAVKDPKSSPYYVATDAIDSEAAGLTVEQMYAMGDVYFDKVPFPADKEYKYGDNPELDSNLQTAMMWYWKAANDGYEPAQHDLGYIYMNGYGIEKYDYDKARYWFSRSANTGNFDSQMNMGEIYFKGLGVKYNPTVGFGWYNKAAEQEYAPAQYMVGYCYANGEGVMQDFRKALDYYEMAAVQGDIEAAFEAGHFYLTDEVLPEPDFTMAAKWLEHAAYNGHSRAEFIYADLVMKGKGVEQDFDRALELLKECARDGNEDAQNRLTRMEETWE